MQIGIWILEEEGISCSFWMHRNSFMGNGTLANYEKTEIGPVWEYAIHFARKKWATHEIIQDLITVLAIKRTQLGISQQAEVDSRTWERALEILNRTDAA